jgi:hypothetical protein
VALSVSTLSATLRRMAVGQHFAALALHGIDRGLDGGD